MRSALGNVLMVGSFLTAGALLVPIAVLGGCDARGIAGRVARRLDHAVSWLLVG